MFGCNQKHFKICQQHIFHKVKQLLTNYKSLLINSNTFFSQISIKSTVTSHKRKYFTHSNDDLKKLCILAIWFSRQSRKKKIFRGHGLLFFIRSPTMITLCLNIILKLQSWFYCHRSFYLILNFFG